MDKLFNILLDSLYPKQQKCLLCGRNTKKIICELCLSGLEHLESVVCLHCGKKLNEDYMSNICPDCTGRSFYFNRAFSCFEYKGIGRDIIHCYKYEGNRAVAEVLADFMEQRVRAQGIRAEAIIPVPIHENKLQKRGFNQCKLMAEALGRRLRIPVYDCLQKQGETKDQYSLDKSQRIFNVVNAFSIKLMYNVNKYKKVLLIDDVYTTGSTANECSRVLRDFGAEEIYVLTAATGSNT